MKYLNNKNVVYKVIFKLLFMILKCFIDYNIYFKVLICILFRGYLYFSRGERYRNKLV